MAFSASNAGGVLNRAYSVGPVKCQKMTFSVASGDTSGTATFDALHSIDHVEVDGVILTAATTMSSNTATITFADPLATHYGTITAYGR